MIAGAAHGFVYCVATYGVTGAREELAGTAREVVEALRPLTDLPLLVGVGIGTPDQAAAEACAFADGVIVGSALMRRSATGDATALAAGRAAGDSARLKAREVPGEGIEPSRAEAHGFLRPARLPIPPSRRRVLSLAARHGAAPTGTHMRRCRRAADARRGSRRAAATARRRNRSSS